MATEPIQVDRVGISHNEKGDIFTALESSKLYTSKGRDMYNAKTITIYSSPPNFDPGEGDRTTVNPLIDKRRILAEKGPLVDESCSWIFAHRDFQAWQSSSAKKLDSEDTSSRARADSCQPAHPLLWISGKHGTGKTMLLTAIIDHLSDQGKHPQAKVAYFFCERNDKQPENKEAKSVLRGLYHVLRDEEDMKCETLCRQVTTFSGDASYDLILTANALIDMINSYGDIVYLIIDSLDKCEEDEQLLTRIVDIRDKCTNVRWLISSSPGGSVEELSRKEADENHYRIEMNAHNLTTAVDAYIDKRLLEFRWLIEDEILLQNVRNKISEQAGANFFWVHLFCEELKDANKSSVTHHVHNTPNNLGLMITRSQTRRYQKQGYKYYEKFKKMRALSDEEIRADEAKEGRSIYAILHQSIGKYEKAIQFSKKMKLQNKAFPFHLGILKGNIGKAEACRELSHTHEKGIMEGQKRKHIDEAERCLVIAMQLAIKTGDKQRQTRVVMESAVLVARRALFMKRCVDGQALDSDDRGKLLCQLYGAYFTLRKKRNENRYFADGVRSANRWLKELNRAIEDLIGEARPIE